MNSHQVATSPGFFRRLAVIFYDWVLLSAVILVAVSLFTILTDLLLGKGSSQQLLQTSWIKVLYQLYLLLIGMLFYVWFWTHGGQTLGMKVWKVKIVDNKGNQPGFKQALLHLLLAILTNLPFGLGFIWLVFHAEKQTLYDTWSKTRLIQLEKQ